MHSAASRRGRQKQTIRDWRAAGLDKPSIARADRIVQIPASYLGTAGRIGGLSQADISALTVVLTAIASQSENEFGIG